MPTLTIEQFNNEVLALRKMWGEKDFWTNRKKIDLAVKAIGFAYLNVDIAEMDRAAATYQATMMEFNTRAHLMKIEL
jgi:hypothetical protein